MPNSSSRAGSGRCLAPRSAPAAAVLALLGLTAAAPTLAQTIHPIPPIPGGGFTRAAAISADGNTATGYSDNAASQDRAIRWTFLGGTQDMGFLPGGVSNSYGEASDATGTILAGYGDSGSTRAFRWTTGGGYQVLPVASGASPGNFNQASGINQAGNIVVGTAGLSSGARAFLWNSASPATSANLGVLSGQSSSGAAAVSGDGSTVVGSSGPFAIRYTAGGGMVSLGSVPGQAWALGEAVNTDGSVITGRYSLGGEFGYRWTQATGMVPLPQTPSGCIALRPRAISGDGKLIIGQVVDNTAGFTAFVWTPAMGTQLLANHLAARGVNLAGWQLTDATGISADGRAMCGDGFYNGVPRGWVVKDLPCANLIPTWGATSQCVGGIGNINTGLNTVAGAVYRWERSGVTIVDGLQPSGSTVSGATTNAITWTNFQPADGGPITFFMSSQGACEGSFTIPFQGAYGTITISNQPSPNTACVGQNPSLFCAASTDVGTVFYNWQKFVSGNWVFLTNGPTGNGSSYFGNGTTTLSIINAQPADSGLYRCHLVSSACTGFPATLSNAVQFTINSSPAVSTPPTVYSCVGDVDAFIGVTATPPTGANYQWQKYVGPGINDYADIFDGPTGNGSFFGQTNTNSLGIYAFTAADANLYRCRVTGPCGPSVNTPSVQVLAIPPAAVLANPVDTAQCPGDNDAFFSVTATPAVAFRWQKSIGPGPNDFVNIFDGPTGNGGNYGGTGTANFGVFGVYAPDFIRYRCIIIDQCFTPNAISAPASLLPGPEAAITSGPNLTPGCLGGSASIDITATPPGSNYQWQKYVGPCINCWQNINNGPTGNGGTFSGAQSPTLTINTIALADTFTAYRCIVVGPCGITPAVSPGIGISLLDSPAILTSPANDAACPGGTTVLSATLIPGNYGAISYQWWRFVPAFPIFAPVPNGPLPSGASASGSQSPTLTLTNVQSQDAGQYYLQVLGDCGVTNSGVATISFCAVDFNCSGAVTVQDLFDFLAAYFAASPSANFNGVGGVTLQDLFDFLAAYFAGC